MTFFRNPLDEETCGQYDQAIEGSETAFRNSVLRLEKKLDRVGVHRFP